MPTTHLLYLHGFRSSPNSAKARKMAAIVRQQHPGVTWACPQLPPSPRKAMRKVIEQVATWRSSKGFESMAVVGSSLGGFYATWVAETMGCKAVILNPAIDPARDLVKHIGAQTVWQKPADRFFFRAQFVDELREFYPGALALPANYLAVIAKGDEVLDWREMAARYAGTRIHLLEGGDHALTDFDRHLPLILDFLDLGGKSGRKTGG
jgi:predicted esterase YcpF (UPF0227 family)